MSNDTGRDLLRPPISPQKRDQGFWLKKKRTNCWNISGNKQTIEGTGVDTTVVDGSQNNQNDSYKSLEETFEKSKQNNSNFNSYKD